MTSASLASSFAVSLGPETRARLAAAARTQTADAPALLVQKGDALSDVVVVMEGALRVFALNTRGREAVLYHLGPGQMCLLSLNAAFTGGRYPANVSIESTTATVARIPGAVLRRLFATDEAVQALVLSSLTATISELMGRLDAAMLEPLGERLAAHLRRTADAGGGVSVTHQALADHLGVSRETVSRELAAMRRDGALSTRRGRIVLHA